MRPAAAAGAALLAALAGNAHADTGVAVSVAADRLSNNTRDWRESTVELQQRYGPRRSASLALSETERFGLRDDRIGVTVAAPLGDALVLSADAGASSTHRVLARHALGASVQYEFARAWLVHGGVRTTRYDQERVNQGLLMLEHYAGPFSWSVGWRPTRAFGTTAHNGELRASYYYGDASSVGLILAGGREAASIGETVALASMRSAALVGRHRLAPDWTLLYSAGHTRQGDFYTRNGLSLGIQHTF